MTSNNANQRESNAGLEVTLSVDNTSKPSGESFLFTAKSTNTRDPPFETVPVVNTWADGIKSSDRYAYEWAIIAVETAFWSGGDSVLPEFRRLNDPSDPVLEYDFTDPGEYEVFVQASDVLTGEIAQDSVVVTVTEHSSGVDCAVDGTPSTGAITAEGRLERPTYGDVYRFSNPNNAVVETIQMTGGCGDLDLLVTYDGSTPTLIPFNYTDGDIRRDTADGTVTVDRTPSEMKIGVLYYNPPSASVPTIEYQLEVSAEADGELKYVDTVRMVDPNA